MLLAGPVFFKRGSTYYILPGTGCCACKGGSSIFVFTSEHPLGPYRFRGDVGSNTTAPFDAHSPHNYVTRAQASAVVRVDSAAHGAQFLWMGNAWDTAAQPGRPRNHDLLYFYPLEFAADGSIEQVRREASVQVYPR